MAWHTVTEPRKGKPGHRSTPPPKLCSLLLYSTVLCGSRPFCSEVIVLLRENYANREDFVSTARFILPARAQNEFCGTSRAMNCGNIHW